MRVGDVRKFLPKDDDEQIIIAWWEYNEDSWPEWLTKKMWNYYAERIDSKHDWSYEHEAIWEHFEYLRKEYPIPSRWLEEEE